MTDKEYLEVQFNAKARAGFRTLRQLLFALTVGGLGAASGWSALVQWGSDDGGLASVDERQEIRDGAIAGVKEFLFGSEDSERPVQPSEAQPGDQGEVSVALDRSGDAVEAEDTQ